MLIIMIRCTQKHRKGAIPYKQLTKLKSIIGEIDMENEDRTKMNLLNL